VWEQRGPQHAADPGADGGGREVMVGMVHAGRGTNGSAAVDWWIDGRGGEGAGVGPGERGHGIGRGRAPSCPWPEGTYLPY